jgi:aspartate aminotransferase/aminotransferase
MIIMNSPANPTGVTCSQEEIKGLAQLAAERNIAILSDEIYSHFSYDTPFESPALYNEQAIVIDGFSKSHAMTGWRVGYVHGPETLIDEMAKLQQYSFVCAPQPAQWASAVALDIDVTEHIQNYRRKRDLLVNGISDLYEIVPPGGAFYAFPRTPWGTGTEFVTQAIENNLLIIPGNIFSQHDTHFRISYAAEDSTIERGVEVLRRLAKKHP